MSTLISFIQWWSLIITWRESSLRLSGAVCPSWRRPWPWCCRRQWRRRWCRRRWPVQPCSAYFGNCPANKEIWWCGQKSKHRIIVIFTLMLHFPMPYLGVDCDKVSANGAILVPKTEFLSCPRVVEKGIALLLICISMLYNAMCALMPLTFHIAHLNRYTPIVSGDPKKLTWCQMTEYCWLWLKMFFFTKKTQFENCQHHSSLHTSPELLEFQFKIGIEGRAQ